MYFPTKMECHDSGGIMKVEIKLTDLRRTEEDDGPKNRHFRKSRHRLENSLQRLICVDNGGGSNTEC